LSKREKLELAAPVIRYLPLFRLSNPYVTAELTVENVLFIVGNFVAMPFCENSNYAAFVCCIPVFRTASASSSDLKTDIDR